MTYNDLPTGTVGEEVNTGLTERIEHFLSVLPVGRSIQVASGIGVGTAKGPREENQDRAVVAQLSSPSGDSYLIAIVCDGMGGMAQGGEAAECAASNFIAHFTTTPRRPLGAIMHDALARANREVYRRFAGNGGTTLTSLVVKNTGEAYAAHVGDSRLYYCSRPQPPELLTRDDTIGGQLKSPIDEDALDSRLLQFVGVGASMEPHIFRVPNNARSTFLLTSDGAHSIGRKALEGLDRRAATAGDLVRKTVFVAEAIGVEDNASAVAICPMDVVRPPHFGAAAEMTLWSPAEKLDMWLQVSLNDLPNTGRSDKSSSDNNAPESRPKQKKSGKARPKVAKKADDRSTEPEAAKEKPQLNIEFGRGEKESP